MLHHLFRLSSSISLLYSSNTMHNIPGCYFSKPAFNIPIVFQYYLDCFSNSSFIFPIFLLTRVLFSQLGATYFNRAMYTNCQIPNFYLACFSASPFEIFIVPFLCLRISVMSLIVQHSRHIIYSSIYYSRTRSIFCLPAFYFLVLRVHAAFMPFYRCFSLCLRLGTLAPSSRWDLELFNRSSGFAVLALPVRCQSTLTFYSIL